MSHLTQITAAALLALSEQEEPPVSVHKIAAILAISIERSDLPYEQPGFTAKIRGRWYIFANGWHKPRRRRFTIAHELGHIALGHQGLAFSFGTSSYDQRQANRFAAELLMPEDLVRREHAGALRAELDIRDLADIFLVEKRAMEIRLEELGLSL